MKTDDKKKELLTDFNEKFVDYFNVKDIEQDEDVIIPWLSSALDSYAQTVQLQTIEEIREKIKEVDKVMTCAYGNCEPNCSHVGVARAKFRIFSSSLTQSQDTSVGTKEDF